MQLLEFPIKRYPFTLIAFLGLIALGLVCGSAVIAVSCTTSPVTNASKKQFAQAARNIFGTDLVGARGKTPEDQTKIDLTVAGACGAGSYTPAECDRHGKLTQE